MHVIISELVKEEEDLLEEHMVAVTTSAELLTEEVTPSPLFFHSNHSSFFLFLCFFCIFLTGVFFVFVLFFLVILFLLFVGEAVV